MCLNQDLLDILKDILLERKTSISEYELITLLQRPPYSIFDMAALKEPLTLFRCHFVLFHHLYLLRDIWWHQERGILDINVTAILFITMSNTKSAVEPKDHLRDYYLNWQNIDSTSQLDVKEMLLSFWRQMHGDMSLIDTKDIQQAMNLLGVNSHYDFNTLRGHYRKMLHLHHPDKGGDEDMCKKIEWAYRVLKSQK